MSGIPLTSGQLLDKRNVPVRDKFTGQVVNVDYSARQIDVVLEGQSKVRVVVPDHLAESLGTNHARQVVAGSTVYVQRFGDEFVATGFSNRTFLPYIAKGYLSAPAWTSGYPKQVGTNVFADWGTVVGATGYEIWQNSAPSPNGATLIAQVGQATTYSWTLNPGQTSELLGGNQGFESGTFDDWNVLTGGTSAWQVVSDDKHSGTYSVHVDLAYPYLHSFTSDNIPVAASSQLLFSFWHKVTARSGNGVLTVTLTEYDSSGSSVASTVATLSSTDAAWTQYSTAITTNASTATVYIQVSASALLDPGVVTAYLDDFSLLGESPSAGSNLLYALRTVDANGNASPFSTWLTAPQQSAKLGANSLSIDPATGRIHDDTFGAVPVVSIDQVGFTSTGWELPLDNSIPTAIETWTYVSSTHFSVPYDISSRYVDGVRLRWKQGGNYQYAIVQSSVYSGGVTDVTIGGGNTLADAAITDNYYSWSLAAWGYGASEDPAGYHQPVTIGNTGLSAKLTVDAAQVLSLETINHDDLSNIGTDDHHAQLHKASHAHGGGDALVVISASEPGSPFAGMLWVDNS